MDWLENARVRYQELQKAEQVRCAGRNTFLKVHSEADIPEDCEMITSVSVQWDKDEHETVDLISRIIERAPILTSIRINAGMSWQQLCRLDLSKIQHLSVALCDLPDESVLYAPILKVFWLSVCRQITTLERMVTPMPHIDFSHMSLIEEIHFSEMGLFDPTDLRNLRFLKRVHITGAGICNLNWLYDASYRLTHLCLRSNEINSCCGIETQTELIELDMCFNNLLDDISPIEKLRKLKVLNLTECDLSSEGNLRKMNIDTLVITAQDLIKKSAKYQTSSILNTAVLFFRSEEKRMSRIEELPDYQQKSLSLRMRVPAEERLKGFIWNAFKNLIADMEEEKWVYYDHRTTKENYIQLVMQACNAYFPFLELMERNNAPWIRTIKK